jgi:hypothetical protein
MRLPVSTPCAVERRPAAAKGGDRQVGPWEVFRPVEGGAVNREKGYGALRACPRNDRPDFRRDVLPLDRLSAVVPTTVGKRKDDQ